MRYLLGFLDWLFYRQPELSTVEQWRQVWAAEIIKPKRGEGQG